jgi:uncharacterized membrane protein YgcG
MTALRLGLLLLLLLQTTANGLELPQLTDSINDFAGIIPPASYQDLQERLRRFKARSGHTVVIVTLATLDGETVDAVAARAFTRLPLGDAELRKTVVIVVARKEHATALEIGADLSDLFPQPQAQKKIQSHVDLYLDGLRPDLGIHAAVFFVFRVIRGEVRVDSTTDVEKLEDSSTRGAEAGPIFAILLAPFLSFFVAGLWGICSTNYGVQRSVRLVIGAVLAGGTATVLATLMNMLGSVADGLWYFILVISIALGAFGSLTEFWMAGDWRGIPRIKDRVKRKPEDNIGI